MLEYVLAYGPDQIHLAPLHMHRVKLFWQQFVHPLEGAVCTEAFLNSHLIETPFARFCLLICLPASQLRLRIPRLECRGSHVHDVIG
jgi:hypothetical protein